MDTLINWLNSEAFRFVVSASNFAFFVAYLALILGVSIRVIYKRRPIGVSLAWLFTIYVLPGVGLVIYLMFGEFYLGRKRAMRAQSLEPALLELQKDYLAALPEQGLHLSDQARPVCQFVDNRLGFPPLANNALDIIDQPLEILIEFREQIAKAKHSVVMEFYIWEPGGLADEVADALIQASHRGVQCTLLLDSIGSHNFFKSDWPARMVAAGVDLVEALPARIYRMWLQRQDLRLHRKIVVIDAEVAYTGSMNLVDPRYFNRDKNVGEWVDIMVRAKGDVVNQLMMVVQWDLALEVGRSAFHRLQLHPASTQYDSCEVQVVPSGPGLREDAVHQMLLSAIYSAKTELVLTTPYFVPDDALIIALKTAAIRGVRVRLIVPAKNDSIMVSYACRSYFDQLLDAGVEIYLYNGGLLHTKSLVVDRVVSYVGTVNLDMRSFWLNFEVTLLVDDSGFAKKLAFIQEGYIADSQRLDVQRWRSRPRIQKFVENSFYLVSPLL